MTTLSVLVPVYNEEHLVAASLERLEILATSPHLSRIEVIVVDDCSSDGTPKVLQDFARSRAAQTSSRMAWTFLRHDKNGGKGKAIRTALELATGDLSIIHDADLEYHPKDILRIVDVFIQEDADAVYGSRFAGGDSRRVLMYRHQLGNRLLTFLCNVATNLNLTDMETCYKAVRTHLLRSIPLVSDDFRLEVELTVKLAKRQAAIFEVPISYSGRTYQEGKKINWKDGFAALWAILRFSLSDNIYRKDEYGSQVLARLGRAPRFNGWMADTIRPFCGNRVLEIGSGVGNLTQKLLPRMKYVVSDINPLYLQTLASLRRDRPYLRASFCDVTDLSSFPKTEEGYDTVICLNVIEHVADDRGALSNIKNVLADDGRALILVPQGQWNFGTLDDALGHHRRYSKEDLRKLAEVCGMQIVKMIEFNRIGTVAWLLNGKILRRKTFGLGQIVMLNVLTPVFRLIDRALPLPSLSLIAVMQRNA
jgi:glycosyltransferase involved in cell wall biosynthesis